MHDTGHVVAAVAHAVRTGRRIAIRGGGHCYEGFRHAQSVRLP